MSAFGVTQTELPNEPGEVRASISMPAPKRRNITYTPLYQAMIDFQDSPIVGLPYELLFSICDLLPESDVVKLRSTCQALHRVLLHSNQHKYFRMGRHIEIKAFKEFDAKFDYQMYVCKAQQGLRGCQICLGRWKTTRFKKFGKRLCERCFLANTIRRPSLPECALHLYATNLPAPPIAIGKLLRYGVEQTLLDTYSGELHKLLPYTPADRFYWKNDVIHLVEHIHQMEYENIVSAYATLDARTTIHGYGAYIAAEYQFLSTVIQQLFQRYQQDTENLLVQLLRNHFDPIYNHGSFGVTRFPIPIQRQLDELLRAQSPYKRFIGRMTRYNPMTSNAMELQIIRAEEVQFAWDVLFTVDFTKEFISKNWKTIAVNLFSGHHRKSLALNMQLVLGQQTECYKCPEIVCNVAGYDEHVLSKHPEVYGEDWTPVSLLWSAQNSDLALL